MAKNAKDEPTPGIVLVDKPAGWTSHDVVGRMRRLAGTRKVGHAGTLDPMATGLLVIGVGKATKLLTYVVGHDKVYEATIRLGQATVTDDAEGDITSEADATGVTADQIGAAIADLTGDIMQVPSAVSAIKINGERAYKRVRDGEDVEIPARPVTVTEFKVLGARRVGAVIDLDVRVDVSSGTYVRALARDLGAALGVGGHLTALRRLSVGDFEVADAMTLDTLGAMVEAGGEVPRLSLGDAAADILPVRALTPREATTLGFGQSLEGEEALVEGGLLAGLTADSELVAIVKQVDGRLKPEIVFKPSQA
ncbi:tRNA pseudouridine(55) synthase TruB [Demequina sp. B12]|uniref:tRNA pseudouridine(55) synthase TruB n=1 Tax=Demequina sp. B12 TaxID=2992757 RepID=UPI00237A6630|nr:tRNA pseudouridine(55) synthase TruB [Demequina sp. B12]MDE0573388.1 tRNA pseudouridine(55) synthase TruB [Demequina sp. B12]